MNQYDETGLGENILPKPNTPLTPLKYTPSVSLELQHLPLKALT